MKLLKNLIQARKDLGRELTQIEITYSNPKLWQVIEDLNKSLLELNINAKVMWNNNTLIVVKKKRRLI